MERIIQIIGANASFFEQYGNYILIPLFLLIFILDWKVLKSNFSKPLQKIFRTLLIISAFVLGGLIYTINFPLKPMIKTLSKVDNAIGTEMVHFEYLNIAKDEVETLNDHKDKIVLLNFWGTYCPPCIKEFPDLKKLEAKFPEDLVVIAISDESPEKIKRFVSRTESPSIIGWKRNYDWINPEKFLPLSIIIDKGEVKKRFFGRKTYEEFLKIIGQINEER